MAKVTTPLGDIVFIPRQAAAPVDENYEWSTDITQAINGTEQPLKLRESARRSVGYVMPLQILDEQDVWNSIYGGLRKKFGVPMWHESQYVGDLGIGTVIACDRVNFDLRPGSLVLLYSSNLLWQIRLIQSVGSGNIVLSAGTTVQAGAYLMPMYIGYIDGNVTRESRMNSSLFKVKWEIEDVRTWDEVVPTQYLGNDIYYDVPITDSDKLDTGFQQDYDKIDFELGPIARRTKWLNARFSFTYRVVCEGAAESQVWKNFLRRRYGRFRKFWSPTFEHNLKVQNTGTIADTITVARDSLDAYGTQRTHVAFLADGVWYPRALSGLSIVSADSVQFTLSSALNIPAASLNRASYLGLYRLDADSIDLSWIGNNVLDSQVRVLELTP